MNKLEKLKSLIERLAGKIKLKATPATDDNNSFYTLFGDSPAGDSEYPDILERDKIAKVISHSIKNSQSQVNFLVAGEWGIGKTSILNKIADDLRGSSTKSIWFSPWRYSGSRDKSHAISTAFLTKLSEEFGKTNEVKELYIKRHIESERNWVSQLILLAAVLFRYFLYGAVIASLLWLIWLLLSLSPKLSELAETLLTTLPVKDRLALLISASALLALPPLGEYFLNKIREKAEMERMTSPELIERKFKSLIEQSVKFRTWQRILSWWEETVSKTPAFFLGKSVTQIFYKCDFLRIKKVVVFIDDLDRCEDEEVKEFLTGMKTFLEHRRLYYIIAADVDKLRDKANKDEPEFLRKIVQIDWNVPPLSRDELKKFIRYLLEQAGAEKDFVDIERVAYLFSLNPNPRKIKYYLRRLLFLVNYERATRSQ